MSNPDVALPDKIGVGVSAPNPEVERLMTQPVESIESQLMTSLNNAQGEPASITIPSEPTITPPTPQSTVVGQGTETPKTEQPVAVVEPAKVVEPNVAPTFAELQAKNGIKTPDDLAKSYVELQRAYTKKRQEEARQATQPIMPIPQAQPVTDYNDPNQAFLQELQEKPLETMAKFNQIVNRPLLDELEAYKMKNNMLELSRNPKTADFSTPEVQTAMMKEYESHPEWLATQTEMNRHFEDAYYIARGKLRDEQIMKAQIEAKKQAEAAIGLRKAGTVEGATPNVQQAPINLNNAPADALLPELIKAFQREGKNY